MQFPSKGARRRAPPLHSLALRPAILAGAFVLAAAGGSQSDGNGHGSAGAKKPVPVPEPLILVRGEGQQELVAPRDEELGYRITLDFGVLGSPTVGTVTTTSQVTPFHPEGLLALSEADDASAEQVVLSARAAGQYSLYSVVETVTSRILPQAWPRAIHRSIQTGTENRQRELLLGTREDGSVASYRGDGHCKGCEDRAHFVKPNWIWQDERHCSKCNRAEHRLWRDARTKPVPEDAVDMLSAVMLARSMVSQGRPSASFPVISSDKVWLVDLRRGRRARVSVPAGTFDVVEVLLAARPPQGTEREPSTFEGLFGIHGAISIWMHPESGVPVQITGLVPAGPLELDVAVELTSFRGTPATFRPGPK